MSLKVLKPIESLGHSILIITPAFGRIVIYMMTSMSWFFRPPFRLKNFVDEMVFMGNKSLFIVALTASFSGMVFAFQIYSGFTAFSVDSFVGKSHPS